MDRLEAMTILVDVVAEGSFAAAGRKHGLPRAVVSKQVQALEDAFGARFFHRTTRRLGLTEAGARFHAHCEAILGALRAAEEDLDARAGKPRGVLRITVPSAFAERQLLVVLGEFTALHPDVELDVDCSERFVDFVREGFDVGVRICREPPLGLVAKKLARSSLVICGSPEYLARRGRPKRIEDLGRHECLGWATHANATVWDLGRDGGQKVKIGPRHRTNDNRLLRHFAIEGRGLAQLPAYFVEDDVAAGRLVTVLDHHRDTTRSVFVVYPDRRHLAPKVRAMVDHLTRAFAGHGW